MQVKFADFEGVTGYATRKNAHMRGAEVAEHAARAFPEFNGEKYNYTAWCIIALPNGRFAPCFIIGNITPPGVMGWLAGMRNVCILG